MKHNQPVAQPHDIQCVFCPRIVTVLTVSVTHDHLGYRLDHLQEFMAKRHARALNRGAFYMVRERHSRPELFFSQLTPSSAAHARGRWFLPLIGLEVGKAIWVCPTCHEQIPGHAHYLARSVLDLIAQKSRLFGDAEQRMHFSITASTAA